MFAEALSVTLLTAALVTGASAMLSRRFWESAPWLAPAYGLLGLGLVAHVAWILCWWSRTACVVFSLAVVIASAATVVGGRFWGLWRSWAPLTALSTSALAMAVGHGFMWGWLRDPFLTAALRYGALLGDNVLQDKFAHHLWNNLSTVQFYGDWNGSDRPPLQSGILLLTRPFETLLGVPNDAGFANLHAMQWGLGASIVAQIIWIPGLYVLLRALRIRPGVSALTIGFASVLPLVIWNTTFTWPKLMSAGLALAALAIMVTLVLDRPERVTVPTCAAGSLFVLAYLTHGAAAFVAPAPVVLAILAFRGRGVRRFLEASAVTAGAGALLYLPWALYAKYADPNHSRLLKWHFAGVIAPDDRKFLPTLIDAYRDTTWAKVVDARQANLHRVFDHDLTHRIHPATGWTDTWRTQDFFSSTFAIGLGTVVLIGWLAVWAVGVARRREPLRELNVSVLLVLACLACMVLWALVLFIPDDATVHVGTYVWLLVFAAVPFAWASTRSLLLGVVVLLVQTAYAVVVYNRPHAKFSDFAQPHLQTSYVLLAVVGLAGLLTTIAVLLVNDRRRAPVESRTAPSQELDVVTS